MSEEESSLLISTRIVPQCATPTLGSITFVAVDAGISLALRRSIYPDC